MAELRIGGDRVEKLLAALSDKDGLTPEEAENILPTDLFPDTAPLKTYLISATQPDADLRNPEIRQKLNELGFEKLADRLLGDPNRSNLAFERRVYLFKKNMAQDISSPLLSSYPSLKKRIEIFHLLKKWGQIGEQSPETHKLAHDLLINLSNARFSERNRAVELIRFLGRPMTSEIEKALELGVHLLFQHSCALTDSTLFDEWQSNLSRFEYEHYDFHYSPTLSLPVLISLLIEIGDARDLQCAEESLASLISTKDFSWDITWQETVIQKLDQTVFKSLFEKEEDPFRFARLLSQKWEASLKQSRGERFLKTYSPQLQELFLKLTQQNPSYTHQILLGLCLSENVEIRKFAIEILGKSEDLSAISTLMEALRMEQERPDTQKELIWNSLREQWNKKDLGENFRKEIILSEIELFSSFVPEEAKDGTTLRKIMASI